MVCGVEVHSQLPSSQSRAGLPTECGTDIPTACTTVLKNQVLLIERNNREGGSATDNADSGAAFNLAERWNGRKTAVTRAVPTSAGGASSATVQDAAVRHWSGRHTPPQLFAPANSPVPYAGCTPWCDACWFVVTEPPLIPWPGFNECITKREIIRVVIAAKVSMRLRTRLRLGRSAFRKAIMLMCATPPNQSMPQPLAVSLSPDVFVFVISQCAPIDNLEPFRRAPVAAALGYRKGLA